MKFFIVSKDNGGKSGSNKDKEKEKENETFSADSINKSMDELKSLANKDTKPKCIKYTYDNVSIILCYTGYKAKWFDKLPRI